MDCTLVRENTLSGPAPEDIVAANFLASYRQPTRASHQHNLKHWYAWCYRCGTTPTSVTRRAIELYARHLEEVEGLMASTIAKKLATLAVFYRFAVVEGYMPSNPCEFVKRPNVPRVSTTTGLTRAELLAVLEAGRKSCPRDHALVAVLGLNGLRIGEAIALDIADVGREGGYRTLRVSREKGSETPIVPLTPRTSWAIEQCMYGRSCGPLFLNREGRRLDRPGANRIVKRLVRSCGVNKRISAHSFRHTFITLALDAGASVRDVQNSVGHRDSRQVSYYDRNKASLARNATHMVSAFVEGS